MPFNSSERQALLAVKGVGPTIVKRLEEQGLSSLKQLSKANTSDIVAHAAAVLGSSR
jgi:predicted flap endonuclease-1-like 5' DNA nuclease